MVPWLITDVCLGHGIGNKEVPGRPRSPSNWEGRFKKL